jgi:WD40 repeat protein
MLLALTAIDATRSSDGTVLPEAEEALHRAVTASRIELTVPGVGGWLDWSPAGDIFVTEGPDESGVIDVRDAETGESVRSWHGHDVDVNDVAFSSDGSMLATTGDDGAVRVWDPRTGEELSSFEDQDDVVVFGATFSPDGSLLAASWIDEDDPVRVMNVATGEVIAKIESDGVQRMSFSPDGDRLALGNLGGPARVVDLDSGEALFTLGALGADGERDLSWSPDGQWLATTGGDGNARIWDGDTGEQLFTVAGHTGAVEALDWSPDSTRLATASRDGTARVWGIEDEGVRELLALSSQSTSDGLADVAFSPDGERLMTGDWSMNAVQVFDVSELGRGEWANLPAGPDVSPSVDFMPDGRSVVASSDGGAVTRWDVATGERLATIGPRARADGDVWRLDVSPDGQLIATTAQSPEVNVWSVSTGEFLFAVSDEDEGVFDLEWSPDGKLLGVSQVDPPTGGRLVIVDRAGTVVATIDEDPGFHFRSVSFSPDGRLVASSHERVDRDDPTTATVRIWDWTRGEVVSTIDTPAMTAVFDPTGGRIATTRWLSSVVDVWDTQTGNLLATLTAPAPFREVVFSADGSRLATAHDDGTVRLWDSASGLQQLVLPGHEGDVNAVAISLDGSMLASSGGDGIVRVWALDLDDLISIAKDRLTRGFSDDECRQYLHLERCPQTT